MKFFRETDSGYRFDKRIFWGAEIVMILGLFLFFSAFKFDFSYHPYFECKFDTCKNPMYDAEYVAPLINKVSSAGNLADCDWCSFPILLRGNYGVPPPSQFLFFIIPFAVVILFTCAVLVNHLVHNKGRKFDLGMKEQYKWIKLEKEKKE
jgi:hypothetical protein